MIKNILLTLITTLITLLMAEVVLRFFYADYFYTGSGARSLYYSYPNLVATDDNISVHYKPNTDVRSIAVYFNHIEYDTHHHANNFGFLSNDDYKKENKPGILFVGDSFTAGVGSTTPYIPALNKKYPDINLYSMGVTGTGIWNFYDTVKSYQDKLNFDTIIVMSISDDLRRTKWFPLNKNNHLYFCNKNHFKDKCRHEQKVAQLIDYNLNKDTLLKDEGLYLIKAYILLKNKYKDFKAGKNIRLKKKSTFILPKNISYKFESIKKLKKLADKLHKKMIFVHIPEKREVTAGYYRCYLKDNLKKIGIPYYPLLYTHHFDMSMYHKHDGHPNDKGYAYLTSIIEEILHLNPGSH